MIKAEDIDRLYEMLKVWAQGKTLTHTGLINITSTMILSIFPDEKISKNIIENIVEQYEENMSIKSYMPDVLVDFENDPEWFYKMKSDENQKHDYFNRYKNYFKA